MDTTQVFLLTPIVTGLVEAAKRAGLPDQWAGTTAIVFAFAVVGLVAEDPTSRGAALTAIACGLAASGLYERVGDITALVRGDDAKLPELPA